MPKPDYGIRGQTHPERQRISKGVPATKVEKYHLVDLKKTDELSICGEIVDPKWSRPLERWATLQKRCDKCEKTDGHAARDRAEREEAAKRERIGEWWNE
jgi:hypothetical protein